MFEVFVKTLILNFRCPRPWLQNTLFFLKQWLHNKSVLIISSDSSKNTARSLRHKTFEEFVKTLILNSRCLTTWLQNTLSCGSNGVEQ